VSVEEDLYSWLNDDPTLTTLVADRITPVLLPEDTAYPAITFNRISTEHIQTLSGTTGLALASFQVSAFSTDYLEVSTVASGIRNALEDRQGLLTGNQIDLYDKSARVHYANLDFSIWHEEKTTI